MPITVLSPADIYSETSQFIKILVCGPPGAGKTLHASTWPNALYADMEGRLLSIRKRDVGIVPIATVSELEELRDQLGQRPKVRQKMLGRPVDTIVLDTVDELSRMIQKERLVAEKVDAMRQQDWGHLADTLRRLLRSFRNLDMNVVFNVHLKDVVDQETGRVEKRPDIQGAVGNEIASYVDESVVMIARTTIDPSTGDRVPVRHLQTYPDSQCDWVKDHSGKLPSEFPINFRDDYQRLHALIFGGDDPGDLVEDLKRLNGDDANKGSGSPNGGPTKGSGAARPSSRPQNDAAGSSPESQTNPSPAQNVSTKETEPASPVAVQSPDATVCADCGQPIDSQEVADIAASRYGVRLCRNDFAARGSA